MQEYKEFLEKIKEYFQYDEVKSSGTTINVYDLICILQEELQPLSSIIFDKEQFISQLDEYYVENLTIGKIFKKIVRNRNAVVDFANLSFNKGHSRIYIKLKDVIPEKIGYWDIKICKDYGNDELYFDKIGGTDKELVSRFKDTILEMLQLLEEYYNIFKLSIPTLEGIPHYKTNSITQDIDDEFLQIHIVYDTYGKLDYKISIVNNIDSEDIFSREWLDHESIKEFVDKNKEELLKKIPVEITDLQPTTQELIKRFYEQHQDNDYKLSLKPTKNKH